MRYSEANFQKRTSSYTVPNFSSTGTGLNTFFTIMPKLGMWGFSSVRLLLLLSLEYALDAR
jgi:hypothetical protein